MRRDKSNRVRIIAGVWRSRLIKFPSVAGLRPSPDRVRETLFNWLGQTLDGLTCLDLFAGSGALGFEALSRGAVSVVMVERNPSALKALRENAQALQAATAAIVAGDALEFAKDSGSRFDLIFVDPPYSLHLQTAALNAIRRLLSESGRVYVEGDEALSPSPGWSVVKSARAGKVHFCVLKREPDDPRSLSGNV